VDLLAKINFANFSFWMQQNTSTRVKLNEYVRIVIRCAKNKNEKEKEKKCFQGVSEVIFCDEFIFKK
jgi:hypothetical protein